MKDIDGNEVKIGQRCAVYSDMGRGKIGTVRQIQPWPGKGGGMRALVDNGNPSDDDYKTNGMTWAGWLRGNDIAMIPERTGA